MIKKIKNLIKNSPELMKVYNKIMFFRGALWGDVFNLSKLSLFSKVYPYRITSYQALSNAYELSNKIGKEKIQ